MKLTEAQMDHMKAYASAILMSPQRCPWNPFPRDSPWGRRVDEEYRQNEAVKDIGRRALEAEGKT